MQECHCLVVMGYLCSSISCLITKKISLTDGTTIIVAGLSISDISDTLLHALASAHQWLLASGLQLNVSKAKGMLIHSNHRKP